MYGFNVNYDEIFSDELNADILRRLLDQEITFVDGQGNVYDRRSVLRPLYEKMLKDQDKNRGAYGEGTGQRRDKGRFGMGNTVAVKRHISDEDVYILKLICGTVQEVAELMGVCRQTAGKAARRYEQSRGL